MTMGEEWFPAANKRAMRSRARMAGRVRPCVASLLTEARRRWREGGRVAPEGTRGGRGGGSEAECHFEYGFGGIRVIAKEAEHVDDRG